MKCSKWFTVLTVAGILGCGNADMLETEGEPGATDSEGGGTGERFDEDAELGSKQSALSDGSDYFNCYQSGNCSSPALSSSTRCLKSRDYHTTHTDRKSSVIVLSFHGGNIEPNSTEVASDLARYFGWSHYDFSGHGSSTCLNGMADSQRLHITSTNFDEPSGVALMSRYKKAIAIHGYGGGRGNSRGTICVGGANKAQVAQFISYVTQNKSRFSAYNLNPVNAPSASVTSSVDCSGLTGTARTNLVNRSSSGAGGLQLEMSEGLRADLVNPSTKYDSLRSVFRAAVNSALGM